MSSPNLNNLIIVGSMLVYLSVYILGVDTRQVDDDGFTLFCYVRNISSEFNLCNLYYVQAKIWILSYGFTIAFGAMFSKTWRVHSIFTNIKLNKKVHALRECYFNFIHLRQ
jgi:gamma-aminobutyric acid type B receptor